MNECVNACWLSLQPVCLKNFVSTLRLRKGLCSHPQSTVRLPCRLGCSLPVLTLTALQLSVKVALPLQGILLLHTPDQALCMVHGKEICLHGSGGRARRHSAAPVAQLPSSSLGMSLPTGNFHLGPGEQARCPFTKSTLQS